MIFFGRKYSILDTPFFDGFKDHHNHTLPAVDDGVKSLDRSLQVLEYLEQLKFSEIILTPHVMAGVNTTDEKLVESFTSLTAAYHGPIKLSLASEYMLDHNFLEHLKGGPKLLGKGTILVETSYLMPPANFDGMLYEVRLAGLTPTIAHPERYQYMPRTQYHTLKESGCQLQLNILSFSNLYGPEVSKTAKYLLENKLYDIVGTDLHSLHSFQSRIKEVKLSKKHIDMLLELR